GSARSHERRDAREQFPPLADCLRRDLRDRYALARFPPPSPAGGRARLSEARTPVRRHRSRADGYRRQGMIRLLSGVVLAAAALLAIWFLPLLGLRLLACAVAVLAAREYVAIVQPDRRSLQPIPIMLLVVVTCWW